VVVLAGGVGVGVGEPRGVVGYEVLGAHGGAPAGPGRDVLRDSEEGFLVMVGDVAGNGKGKARRRQRDRGDLHGFNGAAGGCRDAVPWRRARMAGVAVASHRGRDRRTNRAKPVGFMAWFARGRGGRAPRAGGFLGFIQWERSCAVRDVEVCGGQFLGLFFPCAGFESDVVLGPVLDFGLDHEPTSLLD
jgi:hypothetical protein